MQLIYPIDIFEDNYNIVRDRFETDSVNVMKNRPHVAKKQRKPQYQFVIFNPLSYCFEETIEFDVKAAFASRPVLRVIR